MPQAGPTHRSIEILPLGALDPHVLEWLAPALARRFRAAVHVGPAIELPADSFDPARNQYRADTILDALIARHPGDDRWSLGIVDHDLFAPGLSFVFGQATVHGCCAVIGLARLRPEFHRRPPDEPRFLRRVLTEAVHEIGHIAGRSHCPDPHCVMHFSNTLDDTDTKGPDFCPRCRP